MPAIAYKLTMLLEAQPGLSAGDFAGQWLSLEQADPLRADGLLGYAFDRVHDGAVPIKSTPPSPYQAATELWWAKKRDAADWFISRHFERWLQRRLPLMRGRPGAVGGEPKLIWERPDTSRLTTRVRILVLPVALRRLTVAQFVAHWTGAHAALALGGPRTKQRLLRLEDTPAADLPGSLMRTPFDGIGAIDFESLESMRAEFSEHYYHDVLAPDEPKFTDSSQSTALLTTSLRLFP
ncbi:EthD domain-containing protein [Microbacterium sp.]|uniref:EthD domain-containing protein n=1 Tax=Microbacterium sp. TaxID=51671 RepID=UPI003A9127B2